MFDREIKLIIRIKFKPKYPNNNIDSCFLQGVTEWIWVLLRSSMEFNVVIKLCVYKAWV